ncbi:MAG: hypothetical protein MZV70_11990 [Desulfobacterales bacterium]|nr:hypothetical protein [Desulfobacterales bacterium]
MAEAGKAACEWRYAPQMTTDEFSSRGREILPQPPVNADRTPLTARGGSDGRSSPSTSRTS